MNQFKNQIALFFSRIGFTANGCTWLGCLCAASAGYLIVLGKFYLAIGFLLVSGFFDLLDGAIARATNTVSKFGGIFDSSLDRYGDAFIFGGISLYFLLRADVVWGVVSLAALAGAFEVSYVRARAEKDMPSCRIGFWERGERIVYVLLALLIGNLQTAVLVLALGTSWTAFQRLRLAYKGGREGRAGSRLAPVYYLKIGVLVALLFILRF